MDKIVTIAIVGTGQQPNKEATTGTPVDALATQLSVDDPERKFLLTAGAWTIYRQAGRLTEPAPAIPQAAAPETLPACSPKATQLVESLLREHSELLPEALVRLKQTGLRLPYELLPQALTSGAQSKEIRPALISVIGERGRWLSQFNSAWSWVTQFLPTVETTLPDDGETIWQEGTLGQRYEILQRLRAIDPAQVRDKLAAVWKQEKAEARGKLLGTFEIGLSAEDEPFLDKALDDRAESVRTLAASLLARIPTSALAQRMLARADAIILSYADDKFTIKPPSEAKKEWLRDGIEEKPTYNTGIGKRAWYLVQILSLIPPTHWEVRFSTSPAELITAAHATEWGEQIIDSWSYATMLHGGTNWITPLWKWRCEQPGNNNIRDIHISTIHATIGARVPQQEAEQYIRQLTPGSPAWETALPTLSIPWSTEFGNAYLLALRTFITTLALDTYQQSNEWHPQSNTWYQSLAVATRALPYPCFALALESWILPEVEDNKIRWRIQTWEQELRRFTEVIHLRQRTIEEIV